MSAHPSLENVSMLETRFGVGVGAAVNHAFFALFAGQILSLLGDPVLTPANEYPDVDSQGGVPVADRQTSVLCFHPKDNSSDNVLLAEPYALQLFALVLNPCQGLGLFAVSQTTVKPAVLHPVAPPHCVCVVYPVVTRDGQNCICFREKGEPFDIFPTFKISRYSLLNPADVHRCNHIVNSEAASHLFCSRCSIARNRIPTQCCRWPKQFGSGVTLVCSRR